MRLIFIRHGDPDYKNDCLTPLGKIEAKRVAKRLAKLNPSIIYSSPLGRAKETASYSAKRLKMEINILPFLEESPLKGVTSTGKEVMLRDRLPIEWVNDECSFSLDKWKESEGIKDTSFPLYYDYVVKELDSLLEKHGYKREGKLYKVVKGNHDVIFLFCHFGVICTILSHLINVSPEILYHHLVCKPSSVTTLVSEERREGIATFRMVSYGDVSHLSSPDLNENLSARFAECYLDPTRHD